MSKNVKILTTLLLIGFFMISYASLAVNSQPSSFNSSQDQTQSGITTQREQADQRQVQAEYNSTENQIQVTSNGTNNQIQIEISADNGLDVSYEYLNQTTHSNLEIELKATKLVEFIDNKTAGQLNAYDHNDTLVKAFDLATANWTLAISNSTVNSYIVWKMTASTTINTNAVLSFQFLVSNNYVSMANNNILAPNVIKFTTTINNYVYSNSQSRLALKMIFKSDLQSKSISNNTEDHVDGLTQTNASEVNFGNGSTDGFFSWQDNYTVDGVSKQIETSPAVSVDLEDSSYNQMYFSFYHGNTISWDPKIGVTRTSTSLYDSQNPLNLNPNTTTTNSNNPSVTSPTTTSNPINPTTAPSSVNSINSSTKSAPGFEIILVGFSLIVIAVITKRFHK